MSANESEPGPRRLVDDADDELVASGLLALREDAPSEHSRRNLLAGLGLPAEAAPLPLPAVVLESRSRSSASAKSILRGLAVGIALGLAWALLRRYWF